MIRFDGITIDRKRHTIARIGIAMQFVPRRNRPSHIFYLACTLLLAGPKTKKELFDMLYHDDPEGGPLDPKIINVLLHQIKRRFTPLGIEVRREGTTYTFMRYFAVPVETCEAYLEAAE